MISFQRTQSDGLAPRKGTEQRTNSNACTRSKVLSPRHKPLPPQTPAQMSCPGIVAAISARTSSLPSTLTTLGPGLGLPVILLTAAAAAPSGATCVAASPAVAIRKQYGPVPTL